MELIIEANLTHMCPEVRILAGTYTGPGKRKDVRSWFQRMDPEDIEELLRNAQGVPEEVVAGARKLQTLKSDVIAKAENENWDAALDSVLELTTSAGLEAVPTQTMVREEQYDLLAVISGAMS